MINFRNTITKAANRLLLAFSLAVVLISCEKEDLTQQISTVDFEIPEQAFTGEYLTFTSTTNEFSNVMWEISDGTVYTTTSVSHAFKSSGTYTIKLSVFENGQIISTQTKTIDVLFNGSITNFSKPFSTLRGINLNNQIIIEGRFEGEQNSVYLTFDKQLECTGSYLSLEEIDENISENQADNLNPLINNKFFALSSSQKSSISNNSTNLQPIISELIPYLNGYIHYFLNAESTIVIDYYDNSFNKLWSKKIDATGFDLQQYVFNIQNILYYISFDKQSDKVFINKFKNISLTYQSEAYELGINAEDRKVVFAVNKPNQNSMALGVYSYSTNTTHFFEIDKNCKLNRVTQSEGNFEIRPEIVLANGSVIAKQPNKLVKYSNTWQIENQLVFKSSDFGILQLGDNLNLIFESSASGLRLSYVDKHLNQVVFE